VADARRGRLNGATGHRHFGAVVVRPVQAGSTLAVHTETVLVRFTFAVALSTAALAGCSNDDAASGQNVTSDPYAVQTDDGWQAQEAVDPAADDAIATRERPPLDWYGEYVRSDYTEMVRLSGHGAGLSDTRSELEQLGFEFSAVTVPGWGEGVAGNHPADESSPEVLLVSSGERTLMALSYDIPRTVLLDFMESVEGADRDEWADAGGVIR
jgi:hypothetical protein